MSEMRPMKIIEKDSKKSAPKQPYKGKTAHPGYRKTTPTARPQRQAQAVTPPTPAQASDDSQKTWTPEALTVRDEYLELSAALEEGKGRFDKGLINKKQMIDFNLSVGIGNPQQMRVTKAVAVISGKGGKKEVKRLPPQTNVQSFQLPTSAFHGYIYATVTVTYKIGFSKTKRIKVTVAKRFNYQAEVVS